MRITNIKDKKTLEKSGVTISNENKIAQLHFPDFLIIGPQRTGTTWLASMLACHPQVWFSNPKEIYYFNLLKLKTHQYYRSTDLEWYLKYFNPSRKILFNKHLRTIKKYFRPYKIKMRGEATACYAVISKEAIESIYSINPNIRIVITLRNPIDRAWSHAKKDLLRNQKKTIVSIDNKEIIDFVCNEYQKSCGNYRNILENWRSVFPPENILQLPFSEISKNPKIYLEKILKFLSLEVPHTYFTNIQINKKINTTGQEDIPSEVKNILYTQFSEEIEYWEKINAL